MIYRYIYKITCTAGSWKNKYYYGQHTTNNLNDNYKGSGKKLVDYYKKHPSGYIKEIISFYDSQDELNKAEYEIIHPCLNDKKCINLREGGIRGSMSKESKIKLSNSLKQYYKTHKHWNDGKTGCYSKETTAKRSASLKGKNKGKKLTEAHKQKLSKIKTGKKRGSFTEEHKRKLSLSHKGLIPATKGRKGYKFMNNGTINKIIHSDKIEEYLKNGWFMGMKRRK